MQLYFVRHGQSFNNALPNDAARKDDPELTEMGRNQAESVAKHLAESNNIDEYASLEANDPARKQAIPYGITHLYCSPMKRALETAQPIAQALDLKSVVHLDMYEFGGVFLERNGMATALGGMTRDEMLADFPNVVLPHTITEAGWYDVALGRERIAHSMGRAIAFAREMTVRASKLDHQDDKIVIVSHGGFIAFTLKAFTNTLPSFTYMVKHYNTAITRVNFHSDRPLEIMYMNRVNHLSPELIT